MNDPALLEKYGNWILNLDPYGAFKHTTSPAIRSVASREDTKNAAHIDTNRAAERYFQTKGDDLKKLYSIRRRLLEKPKSQKQKPAEVINPADRERPQK